MWSCSCVPAAGEAGRGPRLEVVEPKARRSRRKAPPADRNDGQAELGFESSGGAAASRRPTPDAEPKVERGLGD